MCSASFSLHCALYSNIQQNAAHILIHYIALSAQQRSTKRCTHTHSLYCSFCAATFNKTLHTYSFTILLFLRSNVQQNAAHILIHYIALSAQQRSTKRCTHTHSLYCSFCAATFNKTLHTYSFT